MSDAFVRLYEENVTDVYGYLVYRLGSRAEAEASTRATFERAFGESAPFGADREQDRVRLLSIARTAAAGRGLARDDPGMNPDLAAALEQLDRVERAVLALRYGARLQVPGIARVLDLSEDRAFLIVVAVYPREFPHPQAIRIFLDRYRLLHHEAALEKLHGWKAETLSRAVRGNTPVAANADKASDGEKASLKAS